MPRWPRRRTYSPLVRRQRAAARAALYGSLMLMAAWAFAGRNYLQRSGLAVESWTGVDWAAKPEVDLLRRYIRIDTTRATGNEVEAARLLAAELARTGITATVEELPDRRANLWAIVEGADPKAVVLHQHVDTDPVTDLETWTHGPWSADIEGPWLYGRGAFDMKSLGVAQLLALRRLVEEGKPLRRSVLFLATSSEEHGSDLGLRWILHAHPELAERFGVFLTEGGAVEARTPEDIKYWGTEVGQRRLVVATFCSSSRERLEDLRSDLLEWSPPRRLEPAVERFLLAYGPHRDSAEIRKQLIDPVRLLRDPATLDALPFYLRLMFESRAYPGAVVESPGGGYALEAKALLLPGLSLEEARPAVFPDWMTAGVAVAFQESGLPAGASPTDDPVFGAIQGVLGERFPRAHTGPWVLTSSITDARFVRSLGVPAYGFSPFPVLSTDTLHIGGANEQIDLPGFLAGVEIYSEVLRRATQ